MAYKIPNRKNPRFRIKSSNLLGKEMFKAFKEKYPEHSELTMTEFNNIVRTFNKNIVEEFLDNPNGIELPERLGRIVIMSFPKAKRKVVDFGKSNETGVTCYHQNWDTDNRTAKIVYYNEHDKGSGNYLVKNLWGFHATENLRKRVSAIFKSNWQKFIQIDNNGLSIRQALKL